MLKAMSPGGAGTLADCKTYLGIEAKHTATESMTGCGAKQSALEKKYSGVKGTVFTSWFGRPDENSPRAESTRLCGLSLFRLTPRRNFKPFWKKRKFFRKAPGRACNGSRQSSGKKEKSHENIHFQKPAARNGANAGHQPIRG